MIIPKPRIRAGRFTDIPTLRKMADEALARYSPGGTISRPALDELLQGAIAAQDRQGEGATLVAVADNNGRIEGVIVGMVQRAYWVLDSLEAADLAFYVRPGAHPMTARRLVRVFLAWAAKSPGVTQAMLSTNGQIDRGERAGVLMRRSKMLPTGTIYRKGIPQ